MNCFPSCFYYQGHCFNLTLTTLFRQISLFSAPSPFLVMSFISISICPGGWRYKTLSKTQCLSSYFSLKKRQWILQVINSFRRPFSVWKLPSFPVSSHTSSLNINCDMHSHRFVILAISQTPLWFLPLQCCCYCSHHPDCFPPWNGGWFLSVNHEKWYGNWHWYYTWYCISLVSHST